jgi:autotransporter translocation and assembly factor TamB
VDTLLLGTSASGDPQFGFSKYLNDRFVLEYQQIFGSLPESRVDLRYRINRHLSLDVISSTAGKSGADLTWEQKY